MATLKSIKNKYLTASDGTVLGVTTNTENVSLLSFKLATADSLSKFNLVDGFSDDYNDATGVDASASVAESRDSSNFYKGVSGAAPTGGTTSTYDSGGITYNINKFTANGNFVTGSAGLVDVLIVAGAGGGGGYTPGGGGGAGGFKYYSQTTAASGTTAIVIGAGGAGGNTGGTDGDDSSFGALVSVGGGRGSTLVTYPGGNGGSGGGASYANTDLRAHGTGTANQGNDGGTANASSYSAGGGGGASAAGAAGSQSQSGHGGAGYTEGATVYDWESGSGTVVFPAAFFDGSSNASYAGGGGGGAYQGILGNGGIGGGADGVGGGNSGGGQAPAGTANTGGGGGGGQLGGAGGSGIVIIRSASTAFEIEGANMTLQSNAFTAQSAPTTTRIILDEEAYTGETTLNTDLKAYASRDNGTTYTQITLADQGQINYLAGIDTYTKLMLHCDGANGGTTFTDSSGSAHTVTAQGSTHTDTAIKKFGTASAQFGGDGTGDDLTIPDSTDWDIGTGNFTFDTWIYPTDNGSSYRKIFASGGWGGTTTEFDWVWDKTDAEKLRFIMYDGTDIPVTTSTATIANDVWTHVAVVRSGSTITQYINGTADGTLTSAVNIVSHGALQVGRAVLTSSTTQMWQGYIDELRVSKGIARWTANFTPPATAYTHSRRLLSGSVDISGQPAGTNMKYKITTHNQAAGTKETRVYGTSMAWA